MSEIILKCNDLIENPDARKAYLESIRDQFCGIVGYFSNYIPQEIIAVAGFHPARIIGHYDSSGTRNQPLFNPVCSFARDVFNAASCGNLSHFDNIIFPNSCDSLKVLQQMWVSRIRLPSAYTLLHPINTDSNAVRYFAKQIQTMADWLKQQGGNDFSQDDLLPVIDKYNQTRKMLKQLYQLRLDNSGLISSSDLFTLMTAGLIMDRDPYNQALSQILQECQLQETGQKSNRKRIMIIGPLLDNIELLKKIESFGVDIVADEVTNGWRYFDQEVKTDGDLYENMACRYLHSGQSPTLNTDPNAMLQSFRDRSSTLNLDGVIYINQKFCEPHVHHYMAKSEVLKQMNINCLLLEIEHSTQQIAERDLLRIESFMEVI